MLPDKLAVGFGGLDQAPHHTHFVNPLLRFLSLLIGINGVGGDNTAVLGSKLSIEACGAIGTAQDGLIQGQRPLEGKHRLILIEGASPRNNLF